MKRMKFGGTLFVHDKDNKICTEKMRRGARCGVRVCAIEKCRQEKWCGVQVSGFELLTERVRKVLRVQPCNLHPAPCDPADKVIKVLRA